MKNYHFTFTTYKNKIKSLPGFIGFLIVLLFIVLIPVLLCIIVVVGLAFMTISGIIGLFISKRKNIKERGEGKVIEIWEEKK
jgi:hypothetical protein